MTKCPKAHRIITHNKVRDVVAAIYRALRVHVTVEVRGLYAQLTSYGEHKPEDVLVPASAIGTDKATALAKQLLTPPTRPRWKEGVTSSHSWQQLYVTRPGWGYTREHSRRRKEAKVSPSRRDP